MKNRNIVTMDDIDGIYDFDEYDYDGPTVVTLVFYIVGTVIIILSSANLVLVFWKRFLRKYWRDIQNVAPLETRNDREDAKERLQYSESDSALRDMQAAIFRLEIADYARKRDYQRKWWIPWNPRCCLFGPCHTSTDGYKLSIRVYLDGTGEGQGTHISVLIQFVAGKWQQSSTLPPIYLHRRTIILLDQRARRSDTSRDIYWFHDVPFNSDVDRRWMSGRHGAERLVLHSTVDDASATYVRDGTIAIKVILTPITMLTKQCFAKNGVLIWKIPNYTKLKQDESDRRVPYLESNSFYSFPYGYRMKVLACVDGTGAGWSTHLSLFLGFFKGKWDDTLPKLFAHRRAFALMNQDTMDDGDSVVKVQTFDPAKMETRMAQARMGSYGGFEKFALHSVVESEPYLRNDQIVLKICVTPLVGSSK